MNQFKPMTRRMARRYAAFLTIILCIAAAGSAAVSAQEAATPYAAIYGADNPIPAIATRVRPAVVQVINIIESWNELEGARADDQGYGSGVYVDARGYIVTNYHVVEGADAIEVATLSGKRIRCTLQGFDDGTDIAVLLAEEPLDAEPVPMGDSNALQIGELAIAIGNPGGADAVLFGTVTAGIISALDRDNIDAVNFTRRVSVIQTDAAMNMGSSGGALLNAKGELIGIPTLKYMNDKDSVFEGVGFAVPISAVKPVIEQLIEKGKVVRPRMGIVVETLEGPNEPLAKYPPAGAIVKRVEPAGAAGQAGVQLYDIITAVDGVRVKGSADLLAEIDRHGAGESIKVSVYRCYNQADMSLRTDPESLELSIELRLLD